MARPLRAARDATESSAPARILSAALEVFSQQGFDGARTRDIAARAEVTLGLLQYHYGSKGELWKAAVERAFSALATGLDGILSAPEPRDERERLRRLLRAHVAFVAQHSEFIRIMHDEGKRRGPRMRWLVDRYVKPLHEKLRPLIERAQAQGILPAGIAPAHFLYLIVGVGMIFHQAEE
ncbi:MAG: TetR/AcrR family transcriptional regulator, partial [Myxococcales bacterium]